MTHKVSVKISEIGIGFLDRLRTNRRAPNIGTDNKDSPNWKLIEIMYQYFKNDPKAYQDLLKTEHIKNA